jgi:hypothetical protein
MNRFFASCLCVGLATAITLAAEPIRLDLADFKLTPAGKNTEDLLKHDDNKLNFYVNGTAAAKLVIPADGEYTIVVEASCTEALKEKAKFTLKIGEKIVKENFELTSEDAKEYKFVAKATKGSTTLTIIYTNDIYKENEYDRNFFVHSVRVEKK